MLVHSKSPLGKEQQAYESEAEVAEVVLHLPRGLLVNFTNAAPGTPPLSSWLLQESLS